MSEQNYADDLEKELILMEQELIFKRALLEENKEKLNSETSEHAKTKSLANKYMNENKELQIQLNVCLMGTQKLEEENKKSRELLVKLQVQFDAYVNERQQVLDTCYQTEKENNALKAELAEVKEQLKSHLLFVNNYERKKSKTDALVSEIVKKQEILNKEQTKIESVCKESLKFAEKLSEEAKFQIKYVQEAKTCQAKMENAIIDLMAVVEELKAEKEKLQNNQLLEENINYLEMWKSHQEEMKTKNEELQEINRRLIEELKFAKEQLEMLLKNHNITTEEEVLK